MDGKASPRKPSVRMRRGLSLTLDLTSGHGDEGLIPLPHGQPLSIIRDLNALKPASSISTTI